MSESRPAKPFEWVNQKSVLHLQFPGPDGKRIVIHATGFDEIDKRTYSGVVRKSENLAAIGHEKVEEFVKSGDARYITFLEGIVDPAKIKDASDEEISPAGAVVAETVATVAELKRNADTANSARIKAESAQAAKQTDSAGAGPR